MDNIFVRQRCLYILWGAVLLLGAFFIAFPVRAADPKLNIAHPSMAAKYISQSITDPIEIEAGAQKTVIMKFKNTGIETWPVSGHKFISAYTVESKYRNSEFVSPNWTSAEQTAPISMITAPGETADLAIVLKAPNQIGSYTEEFHLASENYSWVAGGYFFLKINVVEKKIEIVKTENTAEVETDNLAGYSAHKFVQNIVSIAVAGGEKIKLILAFQNNGEKTWNNYSLVSNQPIALANVANRLSFADELWQDASTVFEKDMEVPSGEFVRDTIYFRAPAEEGEYAARFYLNVDGQTLADVYAEVDVTVTENAPEHYQEPFRADVVAPPISFQLDSEPRIRVGLWQPPSYVQFRSEEDEYNVFAGAELKGVLAKNKLGVLMRKADQYYFRGGDLEFYTSEYIRLAPVNNPHAVFNLLNYSRLVSWKGPNNFNYYRGALEYRLGIVKTDAIWVINDLLMEDYVQGIGENSNTSPAEYLKAQTVAQRSYAYATIANNKYGIFDVVATTGDQLYLGVESERIMPNFVAAAVATRGYMATYENTVALTPYFGHAVCRTRSWTEKWGGTTKPWLVPVQTNYDCKYYGVFSGHGVGMSQMDASRRATAENLGWQDLVKYYYTGVKIEPIYQ